MDPQLVPRKTSDPSSALGSHAYPAARIASMTSADAAVGMCELSSAKARLSGSPLCQPVG